MVTAAIVGGLAAFVPRTKKPIWRITLLGLFGVLAAYFYGLAMTALTLPLFVGANSPLAFDGNLPLSENLMRLVIFDFTTGGFIWNTGRAVTTAVLIALMGKTLIAALERTTTRVFVKFDA
jgi:energy-coupling factor transport system substrate-specific component